MKIRGIKRTTSVFWILFVLCVATRCGQATESGTGGGTPPVDIPAPVSHLSISTPDETGVSRVSANAGFADSGTDVTIENWGFTTSSSLSRAHTLSARTLFQAEDEYTLEASATATALENGSFSAEISASVDDTIVVSRTLNGEARSFTTSVPGSNFALPQTATLTHIGVDGDEGLAAVLAGDGTDSYVYMLNLASGSLADTITLGGSSGASRISVDPATGYYAVIDPVNQIAWEIDPSGTNAPTIADVENPADIAYGITGNFAIISHSSGTIAVCYYDSLTDTAAYLATPTVESGAVHVSSPYVATQHDGTVDVFATVSLMNDGVYYAALFEVFDALTASQVTAVSLTGLSNPGGIALFNNGSEALVTDRSGDRVLRVNFTSETVGEIIVGDDPRGVAADAVNRIAYVANAGDDTVSVISLTSYEVTDTVNVGLDPAGIAVDGSGASFTDAAVVNPGDATVTVVGP